MGGTRSKRQQEKTRKEKLDRMLSVVGLALGTSALAYVFYGPEPNAWFAAALGLLTVALFLWAFWIRFTLWTPTKLTLIIAVLVGYSFFTYGWIRERTSPSFVFIVPGVWLNSDTWDFMIKHRGPDTVYNVGITLMDEDGLKTADKHSKSVQTHLSLPEIGPHRSFIAKQLLWKPAVADHEHYQVIFESRKANFFQVLNIERVNGQWVWETRITDSDHDKTLLECRDAAFPASSDWENSLPTCFPDLVKAQ